jgi:hypothetical protein
MALVVLVVLQVLVQGLLVLRYLAVMVVALMLAQLIT